jgi:uncharacterized membrane protein (GlpM family)
MTVGALAFRFLLAGAFVSLFAAIGSAFKPKTFSGLFGAAPPIALVTLALAFHEHGSLHVEQLGRAMVLGALALAAYAAICIALIGLRRVPVLAGAVIAWCGWGLAACALHFLRGER